MEKRRRESVFDEEFLGRLQRLHLIAKRVTARGAPGARRSRRLGDGLEFADHRSYAPGDDIRFIDWPYYGRMEKLLLRLFHERSEADVAVLLDVSASMATRGPTEKFDYALRAAAALTFVAMGGLERVILQPFAADLLDPLHTGRNRGQILGVLDYLAAIEPGGKTCLGRCVGAFTGRMEGRATVLLLSDLLDCADELSPALAELRGRGCEVTLLHVFSPADASPALAGPVQLRQAETDDTMVLDVTEEVRASYRQRWRAFCEGLARTALSRAATYVAAGTDVPFEQLVLQTLRQAGVLAG